MRKRNSSLIWRFLTSMATLAAIMTIIPSSVFTGWPSLVITAIEVLPAFIIAVLVLNTSFPEKTFARGGYGVMAALMVPMVVLCNTVRQGLIDNFHLLMGGLEDYTLQFLLVAPLSNLAYFGTVMLCFAVLWRAAFAGGPGIQKVRINYLRLLSPLVLVGAYAIALALQYSDMVGRYLERASTRSQMLFGAAPEVPAWLQLDPILNLILNWAPQPLEVMLMAFLLLCPMRMFYKAYAKALGGPGGPGKPSKPPRKGEQLPQEGEGEDSPFVPIPPNTRPDAQQERPAQQPARPDGYGRPTTAPRPAPSYRNPAHPHDEDAQAYPVEPAQQPQSNAAYRARTTARDNAAYQRPQPSAEQRPQQQAAQRPAQRAASQPTNPQDRQQ